MILVIDDDSAVRSSLSLLLRQAGFEVHTAEDPQDALRLSQGRTPELFVLDMNFTLDTSGTEGLALLKELRKLYPASPVILITAWGSIALAVEGMKQGAADFITKPWSNQRFLDSVRTTLSLSQGSPDRRASRDRSSLDENYDFGAIVGQDPRLLSVLETAGRVSATNAPVLILGESGTGKELVAEAIHENSSRNSQAFVKVNLGGIPTTLFESEMFGHRKGAFTGATADRKGRFELAEQGTLFLDEIGDLQLRDQVKLLRVLQDHSYEVLGASETRPADFRLICATNRDLQSMLGEGHFREDLFYRINLITLKLPPLRERPLDIPLLLDHFLDNLKVLYGREQLSVTPRTRRWLAELPWPGNVRELKNLVERTVLLSKEEQLDINHFQAHHHTAGDTSGSDSAAALDLVTIEEMEKSMIERALQIHANNISRVARTLGLSRAALYRRLEKYGITP